MIRRPSAATPLASMACWAFVGTPIDSTTWANSSAMATWERSTSAISAEANTRCSWSDCSNRATRKYSSRMAAAGSASIAAAGTGRKGSVKASAFAMLLPCSGGSCRVYAR